MIATTATSEGLYRWTGKPNHLLKASRYKLRIEHFADGMIRVQAITGGGVYWYDSDKGLQSDWHKITVA